MTDTTYRQETLIPKDLEAEQAVLGSIIEDNGLLDNITEILSVNSFFSVAHQHIYRAIIDLAEMNYPIDEVLIGDQLKSLSQLEEIGGYAYLAELIECSPSSGNIEFYAKIIQEHAVLRDLIETTKEIGEKSRDPERNVQEILSEASERIAKISEGNIQSDTADSKTILSQAFQTLERVSEKPGELIGMPTGYLDLDKRTNGLMKKDLIIIAARPSMGKTALALNIATYVATRGPEKGAILIISREMSKEKLAYRMLSTESNVPAKVLKTGDLEQDHWDKLAMATDTLSGANIYVNESALTAQDIRSECRKLAKKEGGISLIIADYLQLFEGKGHNREQEISYLSRSCKAIAKDLDIPFIMLSQLNRAVEHRTNKRPMLSDLRESGAIEQDADLVLFIYRDEVYNSESPEKGQAELIIGKNRDGPTGTVRLAWVAKCTKFANLALHEF